MSGQSNMMTIFLHTRETNFKEQLSSVNVAFIFYFFCWTSKSNYFDMQWKRLFCDSLDKNYQILKKIVNKDYQAIATKMQF